jgi:hypothetical protein
MNLFKLLIAFLRCAKEKLERPISEFQLRASSVAIRKRVREGLEDCGRCPDLPNAHLVHRGWGPENVWRRIRSNNI